MSSATLLKPEKVRTKRSDLRQMQSSVLARAKGRTVVVVTAHGKEEKYVLDRAYFEEILEKMRGLEETLEIMADPKLFSRLLKGAETIDHDARAGRLHSLEEAFGH